MTPRRRAPAARELAAIMATVRQLSPDGQRAALHMVEHMLTAAERGVTPEQYARTGHECDMWRVDDRCALCDRVLVGSTL